MEEQHFSIKIGRREISLGTILFVLVSCHFIWHIGGSDIAVEWISTDTPDPTRDPKSVSTSTPKSWTHPGTPLPQADGPYKVFVPLVINER